MNPSPARRQYNTPVLYIGIQRITWPNIELPAERPWKNDLPLGGNFGLHGKTILPLFFLLRNPSPESAVGAFGQ